MTGLAGTDYMTVAQFAARHQAWTQASLRNLILNSADRFTARGKIIQGNGLLKAGAIVRIGRRVLICETAFMAWVEKQRQDQMLRSGLPL